MAQMALLGSQEAKLFVGNLPQDITAEELQYVFSSYGVVSKCHVMDAGRSKSGQACAFVTYSEPQAAAIAIQTLNNVYRIRVDAKEAISVSVAKSGGGMSEGGTIAASLVAMASQTAVVQPGVPTMQPGVPTMPGFAQPLGQPGLYAQPGLAQTQLSLESAVAAATQQAAAAQQFQLAAINAQAAAIPQFSAMPGVSAMGAPIALPQPCKLFVGDLPGDIAREAILAVFQTYGTVTDVHLMTGKSRSGAACCLVEYSNQTEAQTAIATLHQKYEIRPGTGMITCRLFEGSKGKGKGPAPAAPAAPFGAVSLSPDVAALAAQPFMMQSDPSALRYTPY